MVIYPIYSLLCGRTWCFPWSGIVELDSFSSMGFGDQGVSVETAIGDYLLESRSWRDS